MRSTSPDTDDALQTNSKSDVCVVHPLEFVGSEQSGHKHRRHLRVLVVEDNSLLRIATMGLLAAWGITPALAADGTEAVLLAEGGAYDIILMDLQMPAMGGVEAVHLIRKEERSRLSLERMPIVAYTSDADVDEAWLGTCGFDAVLKKPCDSAAMEACLTHWCPSSFASNAG